MVMIEVKANTKERLVSIQKELLKQNPDLRVSQDYTLRKLMDKFEGDLLWLMN